MIGVKYYNHNIISNAISMISLMMLPWSSNQDHDCPMSPLWSYCVPSFLHCMLQKEVTMHRLYLKSEELYMSSLKVEFQQKLFGILQDGKFIYSAPWQPPLFSVALFFFYLFIFLESMWNWNHMVFISLSVWLILLSIIPSRSIHVVTNGKISLFLWVSNIPWIIYQCVYMYEHTYTHLYPHFHTCIC